MPLRRILLFVLALLLLGSFLWAVVNINREVEIANFSTSLEERTEEQIENLQIASYKIDGHILKPGDTFSFNEVVGERLKKWGYKGAPMIYQGKVVSSPGGGLCQLVSNIYNASLLAGMEILERTPHLWKINSVGPGLDATILYDKIDLKFKNNHQFPVKIKVNIQDKRLVVKFFAPHSMENEIIVDVKTLQVYPPPRYPRYSQSSIGSFKGKEGYKVKVYRIFKKGDKIIRKEVVSIDKYEPVPGRI